MVYIQCSGGQVSAGIHSLIRKQLWFIVGFIFRRGGLGTSPQDYQSCSWPTWGWWNSGGKIPVSYSCLSQGGWCGRLASSMAGTFPQTGVWPSDAWSGSGDLRQAGYIHAVLPTCSVQEGLACLPTPPVTWIHSTSCEIKRHAPCVVPQVGDLVGTLDFPGQG